MTLVSESDPPGVEAKDVKLKLGKPCQHIDLHTNSVDVIFINVKAHLDLICLVLVLWLCQETSSAFTEQQSVMPRQ